MKRFFVRITYYVWSAIELLIGIKNWRNLFCIFFGKPFEGLRWLHLRRNNLNMGVTSKMEAWSVKESLLDRFYTRYSDPIEEDWTIVDIGASIGEFTVEAALQVPLGRVYAFEPNPGSINILRHNVRVNNLMNVESHNVGVWKERGEIMLEIREDDAIHARSLEIGMESDETYRRTSIPVISLKDLIDDVVQGDVDLLKLDCEGTGHDILMSQNEETFEHIHRIIMEVHEKKPERCASQLIHFFEGLGYQTRQYPNKVHAHLSYLYAWRAE